MKCNRREKVIAVMDELARNWTDGVAFVTLHGLSEQLESAVMAAFLAAD